MVPPLTLCADMKKGPNLRWSLIQCSGGDEGDRTPDLLTASQALSQLSYAPVRRNTIRELPRRCKENFIKTFDVAAWDGGGVPSSRARGHWIGLDRPRPARRQQNHAGLRGQTRSPRACLDSVKQNRRQTACRFSNRGGMVGHVELGPVIRHGFEMALNYCQTYRCAASKTAFDISLFTNIAM